MSLPHLISPAAAPFNFPTQDYRLASSCTQAAGCGRHLSLRKDSSIKIPEAQRLLEDTGRNMCPSTTLQPWQREGQKQRLRHGGILAASLELQRSCWLCQEKQGAASLRATSGLLWALLLLIIVIMIIFQEHQERTRKRQEGDSKGLGRQTQRAD